jgi:hypothetical protein
MNVDHLSGSTRDKIVFACTIRARGEVHKDDMSNRNRN